MKEYLINSGTFNIIVIPHQKQYFLLGTDQTSKAVVERFLACEAVDYQSMQPLWFEYDVDESWSDFGGKEHRMNVDITEAQLIDFFVLKKFNFGSLVALRDMGRRKIQVFKPDKLSIGTD
jgi:hypothetical protein